MCSIKDKSYSSFIDLIIVYILPSIFQKGRVGISFTGLIQPYLCPCLKLGPVKCVVCTVLNTNLQDKYHHRSDLWVWLLEIFHYNNTLLNTVHLCLSYSDLGSSTIINLHTGRILIITIFIAFNGVKRVFDLTGINVF
jgi:hypothetical protein